MKNRKILPLIFFAILIGVLVLLDNSSFKQSKIIQQSSVKSQVIVSRETAKVLRVVDGDTIEVSLNDRKETVRLIGIDAPETVDPEKPAQCFGKEASDKTKEILNEKIIYLELDPTQGDKDEYGRLLRYVFIADLNFSKFMISEGYAHEYTFKGNSYRYQSEFIQAEEKAKKENKGLWGC